MHKYLYSKFVDLCFQQFLVLKTFLLILINSNSYFTKYFRSVLEYQLKLQALPYEQTIILALFRNETGLDESG